MLPLCLLLVTGLAVLAAWSCATLPRALQGAGEPARGQPGAPLHKKNYGPRNEVPGKKTVRLPGAFSPVVVPARSIRPPPLPEEAKLGEH
jgi:hypothetical protein